MRTSTVTRKTQVGRKIRQEGATLIELLIGLALSLIVTSGMIALMGNSMGSATRIIQMSQLTDELRNTMSMLSRDVRRANYSPYSIYCYGNPDCGVSDIDDKVNFIADLDTNDAGTCLTYFLERSDPDSPEGVGGGGFRLNEGAVEMWIGDGAPPTANDCDGNDWLAITDPNFVNITAFNLNDETGSFQGTIEQDDGTLTQRTRQIRVQIEGQLVIEPSITRRLEDVIRVRNDHVSYEPNA